MSEDLKKIIRQNEVMISLLGRMAFTPDVIRKIITTRKRNPENYIKGYNSCDGKRTLSQIAKVVDVSLGTLSPILSEWCDLGILYEVERPGGRFYKKLFPI